MIFPSRTSWKVFYILLLGFITILFASFFVLNSIWRISQHHFYTKRQARQVIRIYTQSKKLLAKEPTRLIKLMNNRIIHTHIAKKPLKNAKQITKPSIAKINKWLTANPQGGRLSLKLTEENWFNVFIKIPQQRFWWPIIGFSFLAIILLFFTVILSLWAIKKLSVPLQELTSNAKNLGVDLNMPPLAKTGNVEVDEIVEAFNKVQARIRKLVNDRTQMLAAISHDLRTPITRLKLRAESLEDTEQYEKVIADLEEMEYMISSVLVFSREDICSEKMERFDLNALLDSLCNDMIDARFNVYFDSDVDRLPFFGCISILKRAFANLITNAVKYGKKADVRLRCKDKNIIVEIDDYGAGIPEKDLKKVFEPFYRVDQSRSRQTGGTGLGLTIARDTIRAHNGEIELINRPEGGLRVIITLAKSS